MPNVSKKAQISDWGGKPRGKRILASSHNMQNVLKYLMATGPSTKIITSNINFPHYNRENNGYLGFISDNIFLSFSSLGR